MKKCKVQLEKFKKYRFSGENRLFRRFLESSGFKNQFYWQLNHAWWWALLSIMLLCEKTTKYKEKVRTKSAKTAIYGIFGRKKIFSKIGLGHILGIIYTHLCAKKSEKTNDEISRKCQKTGFSGIFPAGKICFSKIRLGHILDIAILHQCAKFHEKI